MSQQASFDLKDESVRLLEHGSRGQLSILIACILFGVTGAYWDVCSGLVDVGTYLLGCYRDLQGYLERAEIWDG